MAADIHTYIHTLIPLPAMDIVVVSIVEVIVVTVLTHNAPRVFTRHVTFWGALERVKEIAHA